MVSPNTSRVLLPSGSRATNTPSLRVKNLHALFVRIYLNVTMASGSGGLRPILRGYDKVSGTAIELTLGGAGVTTQGLFCYEISSSTIPSAAFGNIKEVICRQIPFEWDVLVRHLDSSTYTYSVSADVTS